MVGKLPSACFSKPKVTLPGSRSLAEGDKEQKEKWVCIRAEHTHGEQPPAPGTRTRRAARRRRRSARCAHVLKGAHREGFFLSLDPLSPVTVNDTAW